MQSTVGRATRRLIASAVSLKAQAVCVCSALGKSNMDLLHDLHCDSHGSLLTRLSSEARLTLRKLLNAKPQVPLILLQLVTLVFLTPGLIEGDTWQHMTILLLV
jgi:hypothetical protein